MARNATLWEANCLLLTVAMVTASGCSWFFPSPKNQEEVGAVNVSVTLVAPWDEYITALTPQFTLTADEALKKVIPQAGVVEEKILDALALSARVGFPQTSESITKTLNTQTIKADAEKAKESSTISEEKIQKKSPGQVPDAPVRAQGAEKGAKELSGAPSESGKSLHNDPMLEYTAATALYQEVQLLNRYVTDAALRHNMEAYIVRLQIGIVPFRRNLAYDLYTKIGFFPKTKQDKDIQAFVIPLLVTDNLEGVLAARARDTIRQLSLAASFMKAGIAGTVGADRLKEELDNELFTEVNSLFTLGRVTNNVLAARFGAVRQGNEKYFIIPRTHNVTLVIMVPIREETSDEGIKEVRIVARTLMRSAEDGSILPQQARDDRKTHVGEIVKSFLKSDDSDSDSSESGNRLIAAVQKLKCKNNEPPPSEIPCTQRLLQAIWANDFSEFKKTLEDAGWDKGVGRYSRDLWMDIVESLDKSQFSGVRFELPNLSPAALPKVQAILLLDDTKSQMRAILTGGRRLVPNELRVVLHLALVKGGTVPLAGTVSSENGGVDLVLTFPSPTLWNLPKIDYSKTFLELERSPHEHWAKSKGVPQSYKPVFYRTPNEVQSTPKTTAIQK